VYAPPTERQLREPAARDLARLASFHYLPGVPYDSSATKKRLVDAAFDEFAERGLAGARVDRIADAASANKQAIYAYFGSKEDLFRAVLAERCDAALAAVPFEADDLAGFALGLFDHLVAEPRIMRLAMWKQLELPSGEAHAGFRIKALTKARSLAGPSRQRAEDLYALVLGMTSASFVHGPAGAEPLSPRRIAAFRRALAQALDAVVADFRAR
jgi:AcrR family transcriptional regulator